MAHAVCSALRAYGAHVTVRTHGYGGSVPVVIGGKAKQAHLQSLRDYLE